jgi:glycerol transport system substrate-binding protein
MRLRKTSTAMAMAMVAFGMPAWADIEAARAFLDAEIGRCPRWTARAGSRDAVVHRCRQALCGHGYQGGVGNDHHARIRIQVLAPAFTAITGIKVTHDLIGEGDVVEKLQTQMQSGENIYDAYINDSDLIGTHWRYQQARNLTDWMAGEGAAVTNPPTWT